MREYLPGLHLDPVVPADRVAATVCANGAAMLVRRAQFAALGGFDETFFMEWEDLDLCWRAWARGWATRLRARGAASGIASAPSRASRCARGAASRRTTTSSASR